MTDKAPAAAPEFDAYRDSYDEAVNEALSFSGLNVDFFTKVKADYLLDLLASQLGDSARVRLLDVGCGVGNYHGLLVGKVASLSGIDTSGACIARARERNLGVDYRNYDGGTLPYDDGVFDAAFTICVMHHVPSAHWPRFAAEMARVLRPGGLVAVFEHNPVNPLTIRVVNNCAFDKDAVLLRRSQTEALLRGAGLGGVQTRFILSVPAKGRLLRALDGAMSPLGLGAQYMTWGRKA